MTEAACAADRIVIHPDPVLRVRCAEAGRIGEEMVSLGRRLDEAIMHAQGIGLAAPQIGVSVRAVAVGVPRESGIVPIIMFDPEIVWASSTHTQMAEGCLSIPGKRFLVSRPSAVKVSFTGLDGRRVTADTNGIIAKCVQHEIDHLDGILILDRGEEVIISPPLRRDSELTASPMRGIRST